MRSRIGECLVQAGLVTAERLQLAIAEQARTGERVGAILVRLGIATETQIAQTLAAQLGFRYVDLDDAPPDPRAARLIDKSVATQSVCLGISLDKNGLTVAMAEPLLFGLVSDLERRTGYRIRQAVATASGILKAIDLVYSSAVVPATATGEEAAAVEPAPEDLLESIVATALNRDASDIQIYPSGGRLLVRYRVDGVLTDGMRLPADAHEELVARIKIMAGLDVAERLLPQSGRIRLGHLNFRVMTLRGIEGERLVLRALDRRRHTIDLDSLGFTAMANGEVSRWLRERHGLILIVGPSGGGRTTTIYAAAKAIGPGDGHRGAIVSIEDPVECRVDGLVQTEVDDAVGLTFSAALRSAIAQGTEVIAIGDLANAETATLAALTARSDRLILAAVGGDDAVSGLMRMAELVGPTLAAASITGIVAQRLLRRVCERCRIEYAVPGDALRTRGIDSAADESPRFFKATGCDQCAHTGYRGQIGTFETMAMTDVMRELLVAGAPAASLRAAAVTSGMVTLAEDAMAKARSGVTTLDEVVRAVAPGGDIGETRALCASCGGAVAADFIACPRCGTRLGRSCARCGRALHPGWTFCPYCAASAESGGPGQKRGIMRLIRNPGNPGNTDRNDIV